MMGICRLRVRRFAAALMAGIGVVYRIDSIIRGLASPAI